MLRFMACGMWLEYAHGSWLVECSWNLLMDRGTWHIALKFKGMPEVTAHAQINIFWNVAGISSWLVECGWKLLMDYGTWLEYAHGLWNVAGSCSWIVEHGWNMLMACGMWLESAHGLWNMAGMRMACGIWLDSAHGFPTISQPYMRTTTTSQP